MSQSDTPAGAPADDDATPAGGEAGRPYAELSGLNEAAEALRSAERAEETAGAGDGTGGKRPIDPAPDTGARPAPGPADTPGASGGSGTPPPKAPEPAPAEEPAGWSGSAVLLTAVLALVIGAVSALATLPSYIDRLPAGWAEALRPASQRDAEIAAAVGQVDTLSAEMDRVMAELEALDEETGTLSERMTTLETEDAPVTIDKLAGVDASLTERIDLLREELDQRIETLETAEPQVTMDKLAGVEASLSERVELLREDLDTRISALETAEPEVTMDKLAGVEASLSERVALLREDLAAEIDALEADLAEAEARAKAAEEALAEERAAAESARREEEMKNRAASLRTELGAGRGFGEVLAGLEEIAGTDAPAELRAATEGLPSRESLAESFPARAQMAVRADVRAGADESATGQLSAWFLGQVAGRPVEPQEGDTVPAILSRVETAVEAGDLETALAEAETLPDHAKDALGDWLADLRARAEAEAALDRWLAEIGVTDS